MLARVDLVAVPDPPGIERVGQDLIDMAATEGRSAASAARDQRPGPCPIRLRAPPIIYAPFRQCPFCAG